MQTDLSVWGMYQHADIVVKCVMIGLILASVVTWAIFFSKSVEFFNQKRRLKREQQLLAEARSLNQANDIAVLVGIHKRWIEVTADVERLKVVVLYLRGVRAF